MSEIVVHFDGSLDPGQCVKYGFVIYKDGLIVDKMHGNSHNVKVTNIVAEWLGCVRGMAASLRHLDDDVERLCIKGDCQTVIYQATGRYRTKAEHLIPYRDAVRGMTNFVTEDLGITVDFVWHRRNRNGRADTESRKA